MLKQIKKMYTTVIAITIFGIVGCGEITETVEDRPTPPADNQSKYVDDKVQGISYTVKKENKVLLEGITDINGTFNFIPNEPIEFTLAGLTLDRIEAKFLLDDAVLTVLENRPKLASLLQSMDYDGNATNGISITPKTVEALIALNFAQYSTVENSALDVEQLVKDVTDKLNELNPDDSNPPSPSEGQNPKKQTRKQLTVKLRYINERDALIHLRKSIAKYTPSQSITVQKFIDDAKNIDTNVLTLSESEISTKVKALRTQLDTPLEGDQGLIDIGIARSLLNLSELTNESFLGEVFNFNGGGTQLGQIIKEMSFERGDSLRNTVVTAKEKDATNVIVNSKKSLLYMAKNLKTISDQLGRSLASVPQHYKFEYEGESLAIDKLLALRSSLLLAASKLSLTASYSYGEDKDYLIQTYTDTSGNKYEFNDINIYADKILNRGNVANLIDQSSLTLAKAYMHEAVKLLKDVSVENLTDNADTTNEQKAVNYAKKIDTILTNNKGTLVIEEDNNGVNEITEIALARLFSTATAPKISDFGTEWVYECHDKTQTLSSVAESKRENGVYCINSSNNLYYYNHSADLKPRQRAKAATSNLDELIVRATFDGVLKSGQEFIDALVDQARPAPIVIDPNSSSYKFTAPSAFYSDFSSYNSGSSTQTEVNSMGLQSGNKYVYQHLKLQKGELVKEESSSSLYLIPKGNSWVKAPTEEKVITGTLSNNDSTISLNDVTKLNIDKVTALDGKIVNLGSEAYGQPDMNVTMLKGATKITITETVIKDTYILYDFEPSPVISSFKELLVKQCDSNATIYPNFEASKQGISKIGFSCGQENQTSGTLVAVKQDNTLIEGAGTWKINNIAGTTLSVLEVDVKKEYRSKNINNLYGLLTSGTPSVRQGYVSKVGNSYINDYYNKTVVDSFVRTEDPLNAGIGKTFYRHYSKDGVSKVMAYTLNKNGTIDVLLDGVKTSGTYSIQNNQLSVTLNGETDTYTIVKSTSEHLELKENGSDDKFNFYYTQTDAQAAPYDFTTTTPTPNANKFTFPSDFYEEFKIKDYGNGKTYRAFHMGFTSNKKFLSEESMLLASKFVRDPNNNGNEFEFSVDKWVNDTNMTELVTTFSENDSVVDIGGKYKITYKSKTDIEGSSVEIDGVGQSATMPSGASKSIFLLEPLTNHYHISHIESSHGDTASGDFKSISEFIQIKCGNKYFEHADGGGIEGIAFKCGEENLTTGTLVGVSSGGSVTVSSVGTWEKVTLGGGIETIITTIEKTYKSDIDHSMFAMKDGVVWEGWHDKQGESFDWTTYNQIAADAVAERMQFIKDGDSSSAKFTYEKVAGKTFYSITESGNSSYLVKYEALGNNSRTGYQDTLVTHNSGDVQSFNINENGVITVTRGDGNVFTVTLKEENIESKYHKITLTTNSGVEQLTDKRLYFNKADAEAFLALKRNFRYIGSSTSMLISPNGGETILTSADTVISWDSSLISTSLIKLYLLEDNPATLYQFQSSAATMRANKTWTDIEDEDLVLNNGSFTISSEVMGSRNGNDYLIMVTSEDETQWDISNGTFTIAPPAE